MRRGGGEHNHRGRKHHERRDRLSQGALTDMAPTGFLVPTECLQ